jgi:UDP-N-acetylmuramyl-tripeptide synthetase
VKLSTLITAIEPLNSFLLEAAGRLPDASPVHRITAGETSTGDEGALDHDITSIHYRAQDVIPGGLFVAIPGQTADGHDFIGQAVEKGALAVVVEKPPGPGQLSREKSDLPDICPIVVQAADSRRALADLAACFYQHPSRDMHLTAITGTNGKTTVAYLVERILTEAGCKTGVIGTINYRYAGVTYPNPMTTPESLDLQKIMDDMRRAGVTHVVMEASSHALDLDRIRGCRIDIAVFTNLSQDHLDFHGDMQAYWASKKRLFTAYLTDGSDAADVAAVINCDDPRGAELANSLSIKLIRTGSTPDCDIQAETSRYKLVGTKGRLFTPRGSFEFKTPLVGIHNIENIRNACGTAIALDIEPDIIKAGIESLSAVPGRLESVATSSGRFVYVDYAHTPDALENAISALKAIAPARLICVFGCGGDRDREKRPLMGEIVGRLCDLAVVTSDNPRSESPAAIIEQILPGVEQSRGRRYTAEELKSGFDAIGYAVEPDRRRAIALAVTASRPNDAVLIAGKGHETYQILGDNTIDFDDREEARKALAKIEA